MNTMSRSLKMLNVARLNVKAQKLHPDGSPDIAVEKGLQKTAVGKTGEKLEDRRRTLRSSKLKGIHSFILERSVSVLLYKKAGSWGVQPS